MKEIPDKYFELAIVDPPYGIGRAGQSETFTKNPKHKRKHHQSKEWDNELPSAEYFAELFRVSNNQIIWGANYFTEFIPSSMGWVFWDKGQDLSMSDGELAFTSFDVALRRTIINRVELLKDGTIHPTQKPVKLYKWLLDKYAKQGDKILDTHGGSCSLAIACIDYGFEYLITEKDEDYYREAIKRVTNFNNQFNLFL
ncbi:MAG: site-specific DNA-methyltransferase [Nitrosarchaeum sp.]|nr:site-specific DNA-methyltransferase [Nitrosarchaeum sp.]